jgi:hypothetical protein
MANTRPSSIVIQEAAPKAKGPWGYLALLIAGGAGFFFWNKSKKDADAQTSAQALQGNIFTQQAAIIRNALEGAGTDEEALYAVAPKITDWALVAKAYASLTQGGNIEQDLSGDLTAEEYKYFMNLLAVKGRSNVANKGVTKAANVGIKANKIITIKAKGDERAGGKVCFYTSAENYAKAKPFWCSDPTRQFKPEARKVKFIHSIEFQWQSDVSKIPGTSSSNVPNKEKIIGPTTYLYLVEIQAIPPYNGKRYYIPFYNFDNNGK